MRVLAPFVYPATAFVLSAALFGRCHGKAPGSKPLDADTAPHRRASRCSTLTRQIDTDR
jgi:hypothetical protein